MAYNQGDLQREFAAISQDAKAVTADLVQVSKQTVGRTAIRTGGKLKRFGKGLLNG